MRNEHHRLVRCGSVGHIVIEVTGDRRADVPTGIARQPILERRVPVALRQEPGELCAFVGQDDRFQMLILRGLRGARHRRANAARADHRPAQRGPPGSGGPVAARDRQYNRPPSKRLESCPSRSAGPQAAMVEFLGRRRFTYGVGKAANFV